MVLKDLSTCASFSKVPPDRGSEVRMDVMKEQPEIARRVRAGSQQVARRARTPASPGVHCFAAQDASWLSLRAAAR